MEEFEEYEPADSPPSEAALKLIAALSSSDAREIDATLMAEASARWRKVALVVGSAMGTLSVRHPGIPDVYYSQRIKLLVGEGKLEVRGYLSRMRYCEIRLPENNATA